MELGEKIRQARLEAGLSQRQVCGDAITRNMLSLIEHGAARPSMDTLKLLASRLGKSVSYFLEEEVLTSPNQSLMTAARECYDAGDFSGAARILEGYRAPDPVYDRERTLMQVLISLELAEQAIAQQRYPYALELLANGEGETAYCRQEIDRRRLLLRGRIPGQQVAHRLPSLDTELLLRAESALTAGDSNRAAHLLESADDRSAPRWNLLRGRVYLTQARFREAAACLHQAEAAFPEAAVPLLEQCYRELEDYRRAYEYACKGR